MRSKQHSVHSTSLLECLLCKIMWNENVLVHKPGGNSAVMDHAQPAKQFLLGKFASGGKRAPTP